MFKPLYTIVLIFSLITTGSFIQDEPGKIVFFGDSITAGYGIPIESAFPALIQQKAQDAGMNYQVVNAGLSGETTAGGLNRIDWILKSKPDIFILELGGNDGLRGLSLEESEKNLRAMVEKVRDVNPEVKIILAGMQIPPNLGQDYTEKFKSLFPTLAKELDTELIPFLLEGVGGDPKLNLSDGIHPNPKGHEIVAETVWRYLKPLL
ncbi:MAG: arylesterase [Cytophagia bacterium]|nr:arylesterase [Cytophagia bacterium]